MRQALKERNIAIIVMAALILLGLVFGTRVGLMREKRKLNEMFATKKYNGSTFDERINNASQEASTLLGVAIAFKGNTAYEDVKKDNDKLLKAKNVSEKYEYLNKLLSDCTILAAGMDESTYNSDVTKVKKNIEELTDQLRELSGEYNKKVREFNSKKHAFPCNILSAITFVSDAEEFR
jgi:hypothetical protein